MKHIAIGAALNIPEGSVGDLASFYAVVFGWTFDPTDDCFLLGEEIVAVVQHRIGESGWAPLVCHAGEPGVVHGPGGEWAINDPNSADQHYEPNHKVHGRLSWIQLNTDAPERAAAFWTVLLGWELGPSDNDKFTYWRFLDGGRALAGMMGIDQRSGSMPCAWQLYFHASEPRSLTEAIEQGGGTIVVSVTRLVGGWFVVARDPAGNLFAADHMQHEPLVEGERE